MRYIIILLALFVSSCQTPSTGPTAYISAVSVQLSSNSFIKAKYLTELTYITKDKELVAEFKKCFLTKKCFDPKFKPLRRWAINKNKDILIEVLDLFLQIEFEGK